MGAKIDLRKAHAFHRKGDINVVLTWVNDERAMVLMPANRPNNSTWFIVCDSVAWMYDQPEYLARQSLLAARCMDMDMNRSAIQRIASIIMDGLGDLIRMPSAPPAEQLKSSFGETKVFADGQLIGGEEIRLDKAEGLTYA